MPGLPQCGVRQRHVKATATPTSAAVSFYSKHGKPSFLAAVVRIWQQAGLSIWTSAEKPVLVCFSARPPSNEVFISKNTFGPPIVHRSVCKLVAGDRLTSGLTGGVIPGVQERVPNVAMSPRLKPLYQ